MTILILILIGLALIGPAYTSTGIEMRYGIRNATTTLAISRAISIWHADREKEGYDTNAKRLCKSVASVVVKGRIKQSNGFKCWFEVRLSFTHNAVEA